MTLHTLSVTQPRGGWLQRWATVQYRPVLPRLRVLRRTWSRLIMPWCTRRLGARIESCIDDAARLPESDSRIRRRAHLPLPAVVCVRAATGRCDRPDGAEPGRAQPRGQ